jgi:Zn-dependent protease
MHRYGIRASAPMFVPGLGAYVRLAQYPSEAREEARIGLAGPTWGAMAAFAFLAVGLSCGWPSWLAIAHAGAWLNLLNLTPLWQLDGARGFRALSRPQRWLACVALALAFGLNGDGLFALILLCAVVRAFGQDAPASGDRGACAQYATLVLVLALLARQH